MEQYNNTLIPLGVGIGIGVLSLWAVIELFPVIVVGGAGYLVMQGLKQTKKVRNKECQETGQDQK